MFVLSADSLADESQIEVELKSDSSLGSSYADPLFAGAMPTSANWEEKSAFRHYLTCLHGQVLNARKTSFEETVKAYRTRLDKAESLLERFRSNGVLGGDREFSGVLDVNRSALTLLTNVRRASYADLGSCGLQKNRLTVRGPVQPGRKQVNG